jgi:hypothetical protein
LNALGSDAFEPPRVVFSSVVRSTNKGEAHGGLYVADLSSGSVEQVLDWSDPSIDWEGRGGDRGLRGIAFHGDRLFLAASDEIFVYDTEFRLRGSFRNRYLRRCHEIAVAGDSLFLTSTSFDSVLEYDLRSEEFVRGYCLRFPARWRVRRTLRLRPRPSFRLFDPLGGDGPRPGDTSHINNVVPHGNVLYVSGTRLGNMWRIDGARLERYARIPYGAHNARPYRGDVLLNHTATDRIAFLSRRGRVLRSFPLKRFERQLLTHAELPRDKARPAFGRGLAIVDGGHFVGGSSPATITLYRFDPPAQLASVSVTMDVRNAIHGLELWPFDRPRTPLTTTARGPSRVPLA